LTRLVAVGGVAGISFSAIFVALAAVSPSTSAFLRMALAAPVLLLVAWRSGALRALSPSACRFALGAGAVFAVNITVWHHNIHLIGTGLSTVMGNAQVVFIGLVAWLLYGERPTRLALVMVPVMVFAVALLSGVVGQAANVDRPLLGMTLGIATALLNAGWTLLFREAARRAEGPAGVLAVLTVAAAVVSLAVAPTDPGFTLAVPLASYGWLLALAITSQVLGWLFITPALATLPALEVSVLMLLQPVLTLVWGALLFGEAHSPLQWVGVAVMLVSVALVNHFGATRPGRQPMAGPHVSSATGEPAPDAASAAAGPASPPAVEQVADASQEARPTLVGRG